jgi:hypothetical protein
MGFGAASPPREVFLVGFGGEAAKTNQKLGFGAQPKRLCISPGNGREKVCQTESKVLYLMRLEGHPKALDRFSAVFDADGMVYATQAGAHDDVQE